MFVSGAGKCRCDVDAALDSAMLGRAAAVFADEADRVAVVDHHHGVVLLRQVADAGQIGDDAVHPEDAVGGDQAEAGVGASSSLRSRSAISLLA